MPPYPSHPYVDEVSLQNDQLTLKVEVTAFMTLGGGVEVSGQATQDSGAFASFSQIVDTATATGEVDKATDNKLWFVTVTADTVPPFEFKTTDPITVFVRVAKVWVTVLGKGGTSTPLTGNGGRPWGEVKTATQLNGKTWAQFRQEEAQ